MSILAMAPQCHTRPPKRAVRTLAFVAISFLSFFAFAGDTVVTLIPSQYNAIWSKLYSIDSFAQASSMDLGRISDNTSTMKLDVDSIRNYALSIMGDASSMSANIRTLYNWLYAYMPTVKSSIDANGYKIDTTNDRLQSIIEFLTGERLGILQNIESHSLGITQNTGDLLNEFRDVVTDSSAVRVSFDPRVAVTNKVEFSSDFTNALASLIGNNGFNTNYNPKFTTLPSAGDIWNTKRIATAQHNRQLKTLSFPKLTGDYLTDSVTTMRFISEFLGSVNRSSILTVYGIDGVTNRLDFIARDLDQFHNVNTNLLVEIRDQDKTHYDSFGELKTAVLEWLESQKSESDQARDDADSQLAEINSYVPEEGSAPDTSLGDSDVSSYISNFDTLASVLESRQFPQQLQIRFGGWTLFGAEIADTPIVIPLSEVRPVFDALRMAFSLFWWGLSLYVLWWLIRLLVSLHHKIIQWTFTTTSGPQQ